MTKNEWMLQQFYEHISENKKDLFEKIILDRTKYITVVLENLFQPHNAAAVLRSCDCFGVQDVHIIENENKYEPNKEIDMGSSKWLNMYRYDKLENNTVDAIKHLKQKGYKIVATTPHTNDCNIDELPLNQPIALMFGTEKSGLSESALEHADAYVKLPMYGFTESFNISVSVALALFNVTERMRKSPNIKWQLSPEEQTEIKLNWTKKVVKRSDKVAAIIESRFTGETPAAE
ncbi:MAG: RNA methyltransferase [Crocinitomicaceae bacterium]|nr:RNA methyltransferase [Crocinitomicaceae bacterium]